MTLLAAYNANEATGNVLDVTGNGHDFPLTGGLLRTTTGGADPTGYAGKGLGTSDGSADQGPAIFGQTDDRTIVFWLYSTAAFAPGWIWEMHNTAGITGRWGMLALTGNQGFRGTNSSTSVAANRAIVSDSTWHFWAGTYSRANSRIRLYYGTTLGSLALVTTQTLAGPLRTDADKILVFDTAGTGNILRHVRMYDEELDLTALSALMAQPVAAGSSFTGSVALSGTGAITAAGKPAMPGALSLSGSGSASDAGSPAVQRSVPLSGSGSITGVGAPALSGSSTLSGSGAFAPNGAPGMGGSVVLAGAGMLAAAATPHTSGGLALGGVGVLAAAGGSGPDLGAPGHLVATDTNALTATTSSSTLAASNHPSSRLEASDDV